MSDEQSQQPAPVIDEFLAEIQMDLVKSLENRIREFSAEQAANFPAVEELGAATLSLWQELSKDFTNCELKDWTEYCDEMAIALSNPPFTILWQKCKPELKTRFWEFLVKSFVDTGTAFKVGAPSIFAQIPDLVAQFESSQMQEATEKPETNKSAAVARKPGPVRNHIDENIYLKCSIRGQDFVLPVNKVVEIQQIRKLTPLPEEQIHIAGLLCSRGEMFPIFSLHELEDISRETINFQYFVICEEQGYKYGFAVDTTDQVVRVDRSKFQPASAITGFQGTAYAQHSLIFEEKILLVLEPEKIAA